MALWNWNTQNFESDQIYREEEKEGFKNYILSFKTENWDDDDDDISKQNREVRRRAKI